MNKRWKRMVSMGLVLSFLLALCPLPAALAANLSHAVVTVDGEGLVYHGQAQEPNVTVTCDGKVLTEGTDYALSYDDNVNAGEGTVTVTGRGSYSGSATAKFTILPYILTATDFADQTPYEKKFDRKNTAQPEIKATIYGETVRLDYTKATYEQRGTGASPVTVTGLSLPDEYSNYILDKEFTTLVLEGRILPVQTTIRNGTVEVGGTLDLWSLVDGAGLIGGDNGHLLKEVDIIEPEDKLGCADPNSDGILTAGTIPGVLTLSVTISPAYWDSDHIPEYTGISEVTITITITEATQEEQPPVDPPVPQKQPQEKLVISGADEVTYGQTLQLSCSGGSTGGEVTWQVESDVDIRGEATINSAGLLTPTKAGKVWVTAKMAGNDAYEEVTQTAEITIRRAPVTITVASKSALMGEEVPVLSDADYTVTGLVGSDRLSVLPTLTYETTPDMTREGEVAILASGAAVPAGDNYDPNITYVPGKLTIGPAYPITVSEAEGGTVTADVTQAPAGATVTLTIQPEDGFVLDTLKVESGSTVIQTAEAGEGKVTFTMPDGGVLVTPAFVPEAPEELPFTDVNEGDWFYDSVVYVYFNGLMNGTSDTTFTPNGTTTRGMIVTILYRLAGSPETAAWSPFQDVDHSQYYAAPIAWAAWNGIVNGKTAITFGPNDPITREQMAAILYRYAKSQEMDLSQTGDLAQFRDQGSISPYAVEALSWANGAGLITGKGEGILDPQGPAVRAQVAAIFQRFCEGAEQ